YRGVGHLDSPLQVIQNDGRVQFLKSDLDLDPRNMWLVDVREGGRVAVASPGGMIRGENMRGWMMMSNFTESSYAEADLGRLRGVMTDALTKAGLFHDEAEAMLTTWRQSYFLNPGLRLFYIVPQSWTDRVLAMNVSEAADITRVMVGRVEIVTPRDRELVDQL